MPAHVNLVFDSTACQRCAGDARAFDAFGHVNAGKCLSCDGTLRYLTARGRRQLDAFNARFEIPAADLRDGMLVRQLTSCGTRVAGDKIRIARVFRDGARTTLVAGNGYRLETFTDSTWRHIPNQEQREAALAAALEVR